MRMNSIFFWCNFYFVLLFYFCIEKGQGQTLDRCGFPGLPFQGNVTPYKDVYEVNEKINYICNPGFTHEGNLEDVCKETNDWHINVPPLCRQNFAYKGKTHASKFDQTYHSDLAVDGSPLKCSKVTDDDKGQRWWYVTFSQTINVEEVYINAFSVNKMYNLSIWIGSTKSLGKCAHIIRTLGSENLRETTNCNGKSSILYIKDERPYKNRILQLCEVEVYSTPAKVCGEPSRNPNCLTVNVSTPTEQRVKYVPKPGYTIKKGEEMRVCGDPGKWIGTNPQCLPISGYYPLWPQGPANANEINSTKKNDSNFIVGVAIGVTAASVSTIIVIIVVVVVMRKYYKRSNNQTSIVSDTDGVFLRGNVSSVSSGSPTIQPTYSRPWDDPASHTYEYIYSDTLPHRSQPSTLDRHKADDEINIDRTGYIAPRSSGKRQWSTNSRERDRTAQRSLIEMPIRERGDGYLSAQSDQGRLSSYNELEVDAYGYPEPDDMCRV